MYKIFFLLFYAMLVTKSVCCQRTKVTRVDWAKVAELENVNGEPSLGFAGAVNAVNHQVLIVAGGANFPDKKPWDGGQKHYSDEIHVLQRAGKNFVWNKNNAAHLPEPIAYCGNTSTPAGIVYAGGENNKGLSDRAYLLKWDIVMNQVLIKQLPNLPVALTNIALTSIGHVVYAVGGDGKQESSSAFFSIDLAQSNPKWLALSDMPVTLANAVIVAQNEGIYVIGGRTKTTSGISILRNSTLFYDLNKQVWKTRAAITDGENTTNFSAGTGVAIDDRFILITGGDNGEVFHQIEQYIVQIASAKSAEEKSILVKAKNKLSTNHKGFYRGILLYDTLEDRWTKIGELPFPAQVTATATLWNGNIILSSGEVRPGVRTAAIRLGRIE
jgi:N-acetylneuraminate epimerase